MNWESKKSFERKEKLFMAGILPIGNMTSRRKQRKFPERFYTVEQMLSTAGIKIEDQIPEIQQKAKDVVSGVCRVGSRFTKRCICVQLYEDAIDLMPIAMKKGALFCITRRPVDGVPCIVVDDPSRVYADLCSMYRNKDVFATAIVGSIGKTTTKKMVQAVYESQEKIFCDAGNDNQLDGVGYICQHVPTKTKLWIQEVSEDTKGCVEQISKVVQPNISIITAVDMSHIEEFGDEQGILDEIASITKHMPEDGICITSIDQANTANLITDRKVVTVSMENPEADFYSKDVNLTEEGLEFVIVAKDTGKEYKAILKNVYAVHNIYSALYAFAAGVYSGITTENIIKGIGKYEATGVRQNIWKSKGVTVYADCYNAVAKSVRSAIGAASIIPIKGKRVVVLGDIAEAGEFTEATHKEIVDIVNQSNFDYLLAYGKNICKALDDFTPREGLTIVKCADRKALNRAVKKNVKRGDLVLFKASHSGGLDKTIAHAFRWSYLKKMWQYYWPQVTWRFVVLFN